jgi:hypothetical protein
LSLSLQSWRWCLRCCSVVVSSNGKNKIKQNCTKQTKKNLQSVPSSNAIQFQEVFQHAGKFGCCLIKGREREKKKIKESGDSSEIGICGCGLPARCCQPAVAGGVIYADLWGELSTHLALQALFTQSSPVHKPLLQAFPFPSTLGKVTLHLRSQA